jgi:hypothetical protein
MNIIELAKQADTYADAMDIGGKNYVGLRDEYFAALVRAAALEEAAEYLESVHRTRLTKFATAIRALAKEKT